MKNKFMVKNVYGVNYSIELRMNDDGYYPQEVFAIAKKINLSKDEIVSILKKHNARIDRNEASDKTCYAYFSQKKNAQTCVKELEPYLIAAILTK